MERGDLVPIIVVVTRTLGNDGKSVQSEVEFTHQWGRDPEQELRDALKARLENADECKSASEAFAKEYLASTRHWN